VGIGGFPPGSPIPIFFIHITYTRKY
jgi:hypothetical protein